jgi:hypothetical protein
LEWRREPRSPERADIANRYVHELIASTALQLVGRGNAGADVEEEIESVFYVVGLNEAKAKGQPAPSKFRRSSTRLTPTSPDHPSVTRLARKW